MTEKERRIYTNALTTSRIPRAVSMLLTLKAAALAETIEEGEPISKAAGCGKLVIASLLDEIIQTLTVRETRIATLENQICYTKDELEAYSSLGLPCFDEMSDTDKQEIRELAAAQQKRREADEM